MKIQVDPETTKDGKFAKKISKARSSLGINSSTLKNIKYYMKPSVIRRRRILSKIAKVKKFRREFNASHSS
jgi:alpha-glucuronidase